MKERNLLDIPDNLGSLPNPLDTSISLLGVERCSNVFKSAMVPCVIQVKACNTSDVAMFTTAKIKDRTRSDGAITIPEENPNEMEEDVQKQTEKGVNSSGGETFSTKLFFKQGDDLRTDLLILNMVSLMDNLLKKVNLDLKMRVYGVLATSQKDGIMEFVEHSMPVQAILDNHNGSIRNYLRKYNPDKNDALGIAPEVLDTFIKSCAGSCVMTYILGIGDRHLDNIMITRSGQLFHLDFGFVFGKDPKPLPSPFRLTKEMAMAIGGDNYLQNENFIKFKSLCFQSYNWLRKNGNLIMNLLSLLDDNMIKSGGQPMAIPEVLKVVEERLMLELSDEEAESHFQSLIDTAINALMPKLVELAHILVMKLK